MRLRHHQFKIDGTTYDFRHTQGSYGHLYEATSTPANLVYADSLNPEISFNDWCLIVIAHLLQVDITDLETQRLAIEDKRSLWYRGLSQ